MRVGYVDSSCLVAIAFDEVGSQETASGLKAFDRLLSSNLLEAELRSALRREGVDENGRDLLSWITWILPNRPLTPELERILSEGYIKGADLWHLACALFLSPDPRELAFLTLDHRQGELAERLGFHSW